MCEVKTRNSVKLATRYGEGTLHSFHNLCDGKEHVALSFGNIEDMDVVPVRVHSECLTGEVFGSAKCDCGEQLDEALAKFSKTGGILIYMRQEGRGIGLYNKIDAYGLQNGGMDTVEANRALDFEDDLRDFQAAAEILNALGVQKISLLTNNPRKHAQMQGYGIEVVRRMPTSLFVKAENRLYLLVKALKSGHLLDKKSLSTAVALPKSA